MKNLLKNIWLAVLLAVISAPLVRGQHTMNSTTLSSAVARADRTFALAAADATAVKVGSIYFVDGESGVITAVSGTRIDVARDNPTRHASGATIYIDLPNYFGADPSGTGVAYANTPCTSTAELVVPRVDTKTGQITNCTSSVWIPQTVTAQALTSPTITTDIRSITAGSATLGTAALPFGSMYSQTANPIVLEGATADGFETTIAVTDPTTPDKTITFPDATGTVMLSSLATNGADVANAVTGASNALLFEGGTADAFELSLSPANVGADVTATLPGGGNAAYALLGSALTTNDVDIANSIWGVSNGLRFEGATLDAFEITVSPADTGADVTITLPAATGTTMLSTLATNAPDIANSVYGTSNNLAFEGATADGFEVFITPTDPGIDTTLTIPAIASGAATLTHTTTTIMLGAAATHIDTMFFIADRAYIVTDIDAVWGTAETTGAMDIQVERLQGTEACTGGAGDNLLSAVINATGAAATVNNGTLAGGGVTALAAGDRLCLNLTATPNEITNMVVTVGLNAN